MRAKSTALAHIAGASQHPDGLHVTTQILASFSDANDKLIGVDGNLLRFITDGGDLYNQGLFAGIPLNDFPSANIGGEAYDSYVTIGATSFPANTQFTDDFLGNWKGNPLFISVRCSMLNFRSTRISKSEHLRNLIKRLSCRIINCCTQLNDVCKVINM